MKLNLAIALVATLSLVATAQNSAERLDVKQGKVVYVSGNNLVVAMTDGQVKHFEVPPGYMFNVDGKQVGINGLVPGTTLTQTISTTTKNTEVKNVRNVDVIVRDVSPPNYVVVSDPDGNNVRRVKVPEGTKFTIDGEPKTVFDLKKDMKLKGTVVSTAPQTVVTSTTNLTGKAPATPPLVGVLLIEEDDVIVVPVR